MAMRFPCSPIGALFVAALSVFVGWAGFGSAACAQSASFYLASAEPARANGYGAASLERTRRVIDVRRRARSADTEALLAATRDDEFELEEGAAPGLSEAQADEAVASTSPSFTQVSAPSERAGRFVVQVGAYSSAQSAQAVASALSLGEPAYVEPVTLANGRSLYRVRLGPWASAEDASAALSRVGALGYGEAIVATR